MKVFHCAEDGKLCEYLQKRITRAQSPMDSGNWVETGHRLYCAKYDYWFQINMTESDMEYQPCYDLIRK